MRVSRAATAAIVLIGSSALAIGVTAAPALADSYAPLSISAFGDLAVDAVHQRVFISDPDSGKVVATDYRGAVVGEATGLPGVSGLALSADSGRLYAATGRGHAIVALATDTVAEVGRYPVGEVSPRSVTLAGGKIWFGYLAGDAGGFGSVDPADSSVHLSTDLDSAGLQAEPRVNAAPAAPDRLVVTDSDSAKAWVYDVSSGTEERTVSADPGLGRVRDSALTADGSRLVRVGAGSAWQSSVGDLTTGPVYTPLSRPNAVDVSADGKIAISFAAQAPGEDIWVFTGESTVAAYLVQLPQVPGPADPGSGEPSSEGIQDRGIAWEPGGSRMFAVARYATGFRLWVINDQARATPDLTLKRSAALVGYGGTVTFTAHLGTTYQNRYVAIWANPYGSDQASRLVASGQVDSAGNLTGSFRPTRNTTVTAAFRGDEGFAPRTVTSVVYAKVAVGTMLSKQYSTRKIGSIRYHFFHQATKPIVTTRMTPAPGRRVKLVVERYSGGKWKAYSSSYLALSKAGTSVRKLTGAHGLNSRFRVRSAYVYGASGDRLNHTTYGSWQYFTFRK